MRAAATRGGSQGSRLGAKLALAALHAVAAVLGPAVTLPLSAARAAAQGAEVHHIHGLALDATDPEAVLVATHTGLVRVRPGAAPAHIGEHRFDLMGFTAPPGAGRTFFASGHPDMATYQKDGVGNLGLLASRDGGATWQPVALHGRADFHALAWGSRGGGELLGWSVTGEAGLWRISAATGRAERVEARGLSRVLSLALSLDAAGPALAGTSAGLRRSLDAGASWQPVPGPLAARPVTAVAFDAGGSGRQLGDLAGRAWAAAAGDAGELFVSTDRGATWRAAGWKARPEDYVVAIAAGPGERLALATARGDIVTSRDGGASWRAVLSGGRQVR